MLEKGIRGTQTVMVDESNTAKTMGSGTLQVFATPAMTALMEKTAWMSVSEYLEEGSGTVGTLLNVKHMAPTPVGEHERFIIQNEKFQAKADSKRTK